MSSRSHTCSHTQSRHAPYSHNIRRCYRFSTYKHTHTHGVASHPTICIFRSARSHPDIHNRWFLHLHFLCMNVCVCVCMFTRGIRHGWGGGSHIQFKVKEIECTRTRLQIRCIFRMMTQHHCVRVPNACATSSRGSKLGVRLTAGGCRWRRRWSVVGVRLFVLYYVDRLCDNLSEHAHTHNICISRLTDGIYIVPNTVLSSPNRFHPGARGYVHRQAKRRKRHTQRVRNVAKCNDDTGSKPKCHMRAIRSHRSQQRTDEWYRGPSHHRRRCLHRDECICCCGACLDIIKLHTIRRYYMAHTHGPSKYVLENPDDVCVDCCHRCHCCPVCGSDFMNIKFNISHTHYARRIACRVSEYKSVQLRLSNTSANQRPTDRPSCCRLWIIDLQLACAYMYGTYQVFINSSANNCSAARHAQKTGFGLPGCRWWHPRARHMSHATRARIIAHRVYIIWLWCG